MNNAPMCFDCFLQEYRLMIGWYQDAFDFGALRSLRLRFRRMTLDEEHHQGFPYIPQERREPTLRTETNDQAPPKSQARSKRAKIPPPRLKWTGRFLSLKLRKSAKFLDHLKPSFSATGED